ncbi:Lsr2 family protein [Arthrobacter sp. CJ23]|uniref:histone-like nucleoid-structuring protein Lsr2 n=1 Tax=Arthrobacter sp. CJ23 TaxID=2972479 RepID=UPI00215D26C8|nr:Lsr2 family protein [Arthrobacter sp. CJ23]UVJ38050.1 Lsr2 family protein [Arthrobacter sp. CJ23]
MAKQVIYRLVDDLTGEPIPEGTGESVRFTYGGTNFEIDFSAENAEQFHETLAKYAKAGRKVTGSEPRVPATNRGSDKERLARIRAWAAENGHKVNARGRVAQTIIDSYEAAH